MILVNLTHMALRNPGQLGVLTSPCRTFESRSHAVTATRAPDAPNVNSLGACS